MTEQTTTAAERDLLYTLRTEHLDVARLAAHISQAAEIAESLRGDDIEDLLRRRTLGDEEVVAADRPGVLSTRERQAVIALRALLVRREQG